MGICVTSAFAQDPSYRPKLLWHLGATGDAIFPQSFTEAGDYLLYSNSAFAQVYSVSQVLDSQVPLGRGLISYDFSDNPASISFTDKDEQDREYVVGIRYSLRVWRWMRDPLAFGGGYLSTSKRVDLSRVSAGLVLRGDRTDRRYNRLAAIGHSDGKLSLYLIDYAQDPPIASFVQVQAHGLSVTALAYDAGTRRLVSGSTDGLLRVWQVGIDSSGAPTLTPVQTVPAHQSDVTSLAVGTSNNQKYLVAHSLFPSVIAGWKWTNGSLTISPLWNVPLPTEFYFSAVVYPLTPYGDLDFVGVYPIMSGCYIHQMGFLVDVATGNLEYAQNSPISTVSPVINGQQYAAQTKWILHTYYFGKGGTAGLLPYRLQKSQKLSTMPHSQPATAIASLVSGGTRYVCVGYADGLLRLFTRSGSGLWSQATNSSAFHSGARVVAVHLKEVGGTIYSLSVDASGRVQVVNQTGSGAPAIVGSYSFPDPCTVTSADWGFYSRGACKVAIGYHDGTQNNVQVFSISISSSSGATFNPIGTVVPLTGELGYVSSVRFASSSASDLDFIVSSVSQTSRWNWNGTSYARAYLFGSGYGNSQIGIMDASSVWLYTDSSYFNQNILTVWNPSGNTSAPQFSWRFPRYGVMREVSSNEAVCGVQFYDSQGSISNFTDLLARRRLIPMTDVVPPDFAFDQTILAVIPDDALALSVDPADSSYIYVACFDGNIVQVTLPNWEPKDIGYAGFSAVQFGLAAQIGINFTKFIPGSGLAYASGGDCGVGPHGPRYTGLINLYDGLVTTESRLTGWALNSGRSTASLLTPFPYIYTYELDTWRLMVVDGSNNQLFSSNAFSWHWWIQSPDDNTIGLLYYEITDTIIVGSAAYNAVKPVLKFINWLDSTTQTFPLDDSRYVTPSSIYNIYGTLKQFRWELSPDRELAIVYGIDNDTYTPTNPGTNYFKIWVPKRTNTTNWSSWVVTDTLAPSDLGSVDPTMIKFHELYPDKLFVGLANGKLRAYTVNPISATINRSSFEEWTPTLGAVGPVRVMDIASFQKDSVNYTVLVFGGSEGLSIWTWDRCRATSNNPIPTYEYAFYDTDIAFTDLGYIEVNQVDPETDPFLVYSNGWVLSCARLEALPIAGCPWDTNYDNIVYDGDLLAVLFEFGSETYTHADVNCDGIVDDADLLLVLFHFGDQCQQ